MPDTREIFLAGVKAQRYSTAVHTAEAGVSALDSRAVALLFAAAQSPWRSLTTHYRSLSLHAAQGRQLLEQLELGGYVRLHRLGRTGGGGQVKVVEVLQRGRAELGMHGLALAETRVLSGGWLHDMAGRAVARAARARGCEVTFECTLGGGGLRVDLLITERDGTLRAVEIVLSGGARKAAARIARVLRWPGIGCVELVTRTRRTGEEVLRCLRELMDEDEVRSRLRHSLVGDYVE